MICLVSDAVYLLAVCHLILISLQQHKIFTAFTTNVYKAQIKLFGKARYLYSQICGYHAFYTEPSHSDYGENFDFQFTVGCLLYGNISVALLIIFIVKPRVRIQNHLSYQFFMKTMYVTLQKWPKKHFWQSHRCSVIKVKLVQKEVVIIIIIIINNSPKTERKPF